eukprot:9323779-Lingulodinium_polyedra.AAC.1
MKEPSAGRYLRGAGSTCSHCDIEEQPRDSARAAEDMFMVRRPFSNDGHVELGDPVLDPPLWRGATYVLGE